MASCKSKVFSLSIARANSKNKTETLVYWRSVLLSRSAPLLLYIIKHTSNASLIRVRCRTPATFQMKWFATKDIGFQQLTVVWKSSILDLVKYYSQIQTWRPWTIICSYIVINSNVIEKNTTIWKMMAFFPVYVILANIINVSST